MLELRAPPSAWNCGLAKSINGRGNIDMSGSAMAVQGQGGQSWPGISNEKAQTETKDLAASYDGNHAKLCPANAILNCPKLQHDGGLIA